MRQSLRPPHFGGLHETIRYRTQQFVRNRYTLVTTCLLFMINNSFILLTVKNTFLKVELHSGQQSMPDHRLGVITSARLVFSSQSVPLVLFLLLPYAVVIVYDGNNAVKDAIDKTVIVTLHLAVKHSYVRSGRRGVQTCGNEHFRS